MESIFKLGTHTFVSLPHLSANRHTGETASCYTLGESNMAMVDEMSEEHVTGTGAVLDFQDMNWREFEPNPDGSYQLSYWAKRVYENPDDWSDIQVLVIHGCLGSVTYALRSDLYGETLDALFDYPVLSEEDWSMREMDEANEIWRECYTESERLEYIRENRAQFELQSMRDLMGCVRGKYFAGDASELCSR